MTTNAETSTQACATALNAAQVIPYELCVREFQRLSESSRPTLAKIPASVDACCALEAGSFDRGDMHKVTWPHTQFTLGSHSLARSQVFFHAAHGCIQSDSLRQLMNGSCIATCWWTFLRQVFQEIVHILCILDLEPSGDCFCQQRHILQEGMIQYVRLLI